MRLSQTDEEYHPGRAKAVLEQPSPSRNAKQALGRRNIVLSQSDELNHYENGS